MEQPCEICGFTEENSEHLLSKKILRICESCLKEEKINPFLDQFFI